MKWGVRHDPKKAYAKSKKKLSKYDKKIEKYNKKASTSFNRGIKKSSGLFANEEKSEKAFAKSAKYSRKGLNATRKADKWVKRMQKEFAKQDVVDIEPSVLHKGEMYQMRLIAASDNMYLRNL